MRSRSRHQRHIRLLKKLVEETDYYVAHAWTASGLSLQGKVDSDMRQRFIDRSKFQGFRPREFFTPSITSEEGKMFFALIPRTKGDIRTSCDRMARTQFVC